ncbi:MAG: hypothetical protein EOM13_09300 [Clostridia bacterium]|nr:hypothetical protein [Clostridia bacterium]
MNSESRRDRVIKALEHQTSDRVPHFCELTEQARNKLIPHFADDFENTTFNNHLFYQQYSGWPTPVDREHPEFYRDEYDVVWNRSGVDKDIGVVETPMICGPAIEQYREPQFDEQRFRKTMYRAARKNNKYIIQHSCGDISELFPDLIDIGLDCYQTFQTEIYDMDGFKRDYGNDLSIWGGISTQQILAKGPHSSI